jgi:hypothetical protein
MKAPKIIPWIARKAGISEVLAVKLWKRAESETATLLKCHEGSEFHGRCVERFLDLVEASAGGAFRINYADSPEKVSWIWRHQGKMALYGLTAAENATRFWQETWSNVVRPARVGF